MRELREHAAVYGAPPGLEQFDLSPRSPPSRSGRASAPLVDQAERLAANTRPRSAAPCVSMLPPIAARCFLDMASLILILALILDDELCWQSVDAMAGASTARRHDGRCHGGATVHSAHPGASHEGGSAGTTARQPTRLTGPNRAPIPVQIWPNLLEINRPRLSR